MSTKKPATPPKSELAGTDTLDRGNTNAKLQSLEKFRSDATGQALRTNQGVKISDNQNSLKAGARGPSLLEDFIMREKITHFDHERIPERIVHARDVRGFAVKFYTEEGNFDLVGNNMPVFFIQDAIKFPDFVHAVKPEPHNEMPTGGSAHDTFWDWPSAWRRTWVCRHRPRALCRHARPR